MSTRLIMVLPVLGLFGCAEVLGEPPPTRAVTAPSHEAFFPISTGTHGGIDCNACHGAFQTFAEFTCLESCHTAAVQTAPAHSQYDSDGIHLGVPAARGYTYSQKSCYACHPRGEPSGWDHTPEFPIGQGAIHTNLSCRACHPTPETRTTIDCVNCHQEAQTSSPASNITARHANAPGYVWNSRNCYECHPDSTVPLPTAHRFPISTGAMHAGISCATCHTVPNDRTQFDCVGCHQEAQTSSPASNITARHALVQGYAWASPSCFQCHPDSTVPTGGIDHSREFPIGPGTRHDNIACSTCHPNPADRTQIDCLTCHTAPTTDPAHTGVTGYQWVSRSCYQCHPQANVTSNIDHSPYFPIAAAATHAGISCATCHPNATNRKTISCNASCHAQTATQTQHSTVGGYQWTTPRCLLCHADSQVHTVAAHLPFRIQAQSKHYRRDCLGCHPGTRTDKPWGADFVRARIACASCHDPADKGHFNRGALTCIAAGCHDDGRKP